MRKPDFITFTGADDHTDVDEMLALAKQYPIEWGILFSLSRQGVDARYPSRDGLAKLLSKTAPHGESGLRFSAHLCGEHSRRVMAGGWPFIEAGFDLFRRFQINSTEPNRGAINNFQRYTQRPCIAQTRGETFPDDKRISWLFDSSGGRGIEPKAWPKHPGERLVGYAGGIGPDNVMEVIAAIDANDPYWIDMESKVRTDDRFDLSLCRRVCEAVYG